MVACKTCFTDYLVKCVDTIDMRAILNPLTDYKWVITDKFGNEYAADFTTDEDGLWTIPVVDLPAGLLTEFSGVFSLKVLTGDCVQEKMTIAKQYDCIEFEIHGGTRQKNTIGCPIECGQSAEGALSELVPFTNSANVTINWTPTRLADFGNNPRIEVHLSQGGGIYALSSVPVERVTVDGVLTQLVIQNGVASDGYVLLS